MNKPTSMLEVVQAELRNRAGSIRRVASETGIPYDTLLRVKNGKNDPGYSLVLKLYEFFERKAAKA
jgi:predicted transcriptional regulator